MDIAKRPYEFLVETKFKDISEGTIFFGQPAEAGTENHTAR